MTKRVLTFVVCGLVFGTSIEAAAQQQQPVLPPPSNEADPVPPVVYVPVPAEQTYYMPGPEQRPPRQRRYRIRYFDGMTIPPGGEIIERRKIGLMIPGAVMFGLSYISMVSYYAVANDIGEKSPGVMAVPVLGPFLSMSHFDSASGRLALGWAGAMQLVGVSMFVLGVIPRRYVQYYAGTGTDPSWALTPRVGGTEVGADFGLRF